MSEAPRNRWPRFEISAKREMVVDFAVEHDLDLAPVSFGMGWPAGRTDPAAPDAGARVRTARPRRHHVRAPVRQALVPPPPTPHRWKTLRMKSSCESTHKFKCEPSYRICCSRTSSRAGGANSVRAAGRLFVGEVGGTEARMAHGATMRIAATKDKAEAPEGEGDGDGFPKRLRPPQVRKQR